MIKRKEAVNPWFFIPTQYFAEGIPYIIVNQLSVAMFKSMNVSNEFIGLTSILAIPWAIKFLWSPYIDSRSTKRNWVLLTQFLLVICFFTVAFLLLLFNSGTKGNISIDSNFLIVSLVVFGITAFISATHDIATDGFYLYALDKKQQALFSGIRSGFYRIAMWFAGGFLVSFAGISIEKSGNIYNAWLDTFLIAGFIFIILLVYHKFILPYPIDDKPLVKQEKIPYRMIFNEYFSQKGIVAILLFILLYRFGEGLLLKMAQPFLLDKPELGGLGITVKDVGIIYGTFGILALVAGGIAGGWAIKKYGLRKLLIPFALMMHIPDLLYVYLSVARPLNKIILDLSFIPSILGISEKWLITFFPIIQSCVMIEQFGYGMGFTAFMIYLLYISKGNYKTSLYAISTGIMALGIMIPGMISGWLQKIVGYEWLFFLSFVTSIPGVIIIFFLPKKTLEN